MSKFIFKPPIEERETDELISMKWNGIDYWSEEASVLAAQELIRRKVPIEYIDQKIKEFEQSVKDYELQLETERMRNAKEKYSIWDLIVIFFLAPFIFIGRIDFDGYSLSELKQENYIIKYRQRRFAFILGILVFILTIYLLTHTRI